MPIYDVTYGVTREEIYRIEARNAKEATRLAFSDGEHIETGDTFEVFDISDCRVTKTELKKRLSVKNPGE